MILEWSMAVHSRLKMKARTLPPIPNSSSSSPPSQFKLHSTASFSVIFNLVRIPASLRSALFHFPFTQRISSSGLFFFPLSYFSSSLLFLFLFLSNSYSFSFLLHPHRFSFLHPTSFPTPKQLKRNPCQLPHFPPPARRSRPCSRTPTDPSVGIKECAPLPFNLRSQANSGNLGELGTAATSPESRSPARRAAQRARSRTAWSAGEMRIRSRP